MATFQSTVSEYARKRWRNMGHEKEGEPGIGSMSFGAFGEEEDGRRLQYLREELRGMEVDVLGR